MIAKGRKGVKGVCLSYQLYKLLYTLSYRWASLQLHGPHGKAQWWRKDYVWAFKGIQRYILTGWSSSEHDIVTFMSRILPSWLFLNQGWHPCEWYTSLYSRLCAQSLYQYPSSSNHQKLNPIVSKDGTKVSLILLTASFWPCSAHNKCIFLSLRYSIWVFRHGFDFWAWWWKYIVPQCAFTGEEFTLILKATTDCLHPHTRVLFQRVCIVYIGMFTF